MADFIYGNGAGYDYRSLSPTTRHAYDQGILGLYAIVLAHAVMLVVRMARDGRGDGQSMAVLVSVRIAVVLLILGLLMAASTWGIMSYIDTKIITTSVLSNLAKTFVQTANLYRVFFAWANPAVQVVLVLLNLEDVRNLCTSSHLYPRREWLRYLAFVPAAVVAAMAAAKYGMVAFLNSENLAMSWKQFTFSEHRLLYSSHPTIEMACRLLSMLSEIVSFVAALGLVALVEHGRKAPKPFPDHVVAHGPHLMTSGIYLLRCSWRFLYAMNFIRSRSMPVPLYVELLDAVLDRWALVCILSLAHLMGRPSISGGALSPVGKLIRSPRTSAEKLA